MEIISVVPLPNETTLNCLRDYNLFLKSIFTKQLKSVTNAGGYTSLVGCNSLERIEITDEICMLINAIILKIPCFSVYSGIIISSVLIKLWTEPLCEDSKTNVINALLEFKKLLESSLENMKTEDVTVDINFFQRLIVHVLWEEPALCLDKPFIEKLSLQVVKAILSVTDIDKDLQLSRITVHVEQGSDECFVNNGVLCEINDTNAKLVKSHFTNLLNTPCKIILFAENLDFDKGMSPDTLVEKIIENYIKIVVCQKKISDILKLYLNRRKILVIERTGEDIAKSLELLTGGTLIRDLEKIGLDDIVTFLGEFSNVRQLDNKNKISIENRGNHITFLYVKCRSFTDTTVLKAVINKCLRLVWSALSSPFFLPGPVYFETTLSDNLKFKVTNNFILEQITEAFRNILNELSSLYDVSYSNENLEFLKHSYFLKRNAFVHIIEGIVSILSIARIIKKTK